jgi:hypothetical protein
MECEYKNCYLSRECGGPNNCRLWRIYEKFENFRLEEVLKLFRKTGGRGLDKI